MEKIDFRTVTESARLVLRERAISLIKSGKAKGEVADHVLWADRYIFPKYLVYYILKPEFGINLTKKGKLRSWFFH
jgi:hypothetical protein